MTHTGTSRSNTRLVACAGLLIVALLAGGTSRPLNDLAVLLAALPLLYLTLATSAKWPLAWTAKLALGLFGVALLQLIPLPPSIWTALPGRELAAASLVASGNELGWRPIALDPGAAAIGLLTLVAPLVLHIAVTRLDGKSIKRLLALVAGFALLSAALGIVQRVSGGFSLYATEHAGTATGMFTNRNHHADLLIAGMLLTIALLPTRHFRQYKYIATMGVIFLLFAIISTTSRAGIALSLPAALAALLAIWRPAKKWWAGLVLAGILGSVAILFIPAFSDIFERFGIAPDDQRLTMARDSIAATRAMWPFGSGYGSFVPVYMAYEDLDLLETRYVVAAHNDYLQLALEGGVAGVITAVAALVALALLAWNLLQVRADRLAWAAWGVAAVLLAHSALDFPLRTGTLAMLLALCTAAAQKLPTELRNARRNGSYR
ncbi:hypothetical protein GCM10023115_06360 [Pontixanthobacter gangjinensis]|uniref:O-antigen ligase-related domain-containing protein n=1 Tax=Pontixanthobacter gangjinensis TaxID=1028742 RepID=A0A6I4SJM4_9SPHN|nr:O-antigen ligase family protein [Pontixanthobacter gangjinensis]MXO55885.1 hypothetical protein [Pontixanthobacter gangjinensis]